jgi:hypothetical protein
VDNVTFGAFNWLLPTIAVTPTVSFPAGSGWIDPELLTGPVLSEMARCPSVDPADTQMVWDMGTERAVRALAMPFHSCTVGDRVRVQVATDAAFSSVVIDTDWQDVVGEWFPFGSLPWGHPNFWGGLPTAEDLDGYCPPWFYIADAAVLGRYVRWLWDVSGSTLGYLDVGRLFVGDVVQPRYNLSYGVQVGYVDKSKTERSRGAALFGDQEEKYLSASFALDYLSQEEAIGQVMEMHRRLGTTEPFFWAYNPADGLALRTKRMFMARFASLDKIEHPKYGIYAVRCNIEEYK